MGKSGTISDKDRELQELFIEYYPALKSYAVRLINQAETAEDLVQDVFLRLWEKPIESDILDKPAYLYQMVRFKAIDYLRHEQTKQQTVLKLQQELDTENDEAYLEEELYRRMMKAIESLPAGVHSVLSLSLEGHPAKTIAEMLNIAVETVKKQKQIARKMLRDKLLSIIFIFPH